MNKCHGFSKGEKEPRKEEEKKRKEKGDRKFYKKKERMLKGLVQKKKEKRRKQFVIKLKRKDAVKDTTRVNILPCFICLKFSRVFKEIQH